MTEENTATNSSQIESNCRKEKLQKPPKAG